jgi:hypothetical protein
VDREAVIVFPSAHHMLRAEALLKEEGFRVRLGPAPPQRINDPASGKPFQHDQKHGQHPGQQQPGAGDGQRRVEVAAGDNQHDTSRAGVKDTHVFLMSAKQDRRIVKAEQDEQRHPQRQKNIDRS